MMPQARPLRLSPALRTWVAMHTEQFSGNSSRKAAHSWARPVRLCALGLAVCLGAILLSYRTVPDHHGNASHFDTLIVLGCPPDPDGSPSPEQRERVMEAVREYEAGRADAIIVSGGESLPGLIEADTMANVARDTGVPPDRVIEERQALNTMQNIFLSQRIMQQHGWTTAEVISSPSHLPRASLILEHWNFGWRVRAAHWPASYTFRRIAPYYVYEALGTTALRWFGFRRSPYLPSSRQNAVAAPSRMPHSAGRTQSAP